MLKAITDLIGTYLDGTHGASGRVQGAVVALALGLGCLKAVRIGWAVDMFFWRQFIRPAKDLKKYGSWAAVTGATDGIGRAYCDKLAKQGLNVLLISRTESKLKAAAEEVATTYGVETKILAMDLVAAGNAPYEGPEWTEFKAMIESLEVGVFINNAGQSIFPAFVHENSTSEVDNCVAINCAAVVKATHAVLPGMLARGKGAIVNISSAAGTPEATPYLSIYGSTKAFVDHFSLSLAEEVRSQGIDVQAQAPAFVSTKMSKMKPSLDAPSADRYVAAAVRHIGYENHAVPYIKHALDRPIMQLPRAILMPMFKRSLSKIRAKKGIPQNETDRKNE